jgi:hypothetical protein
LNGQVAIVPRNPAIAGKADHHGVKAAASVRAPHEQPVVRPSGGGRGNGLRYCRRVALKSSG